MVSRPRGWAGDFNRLAKGDFIFDLRPQVIISNIRLKASFILDFQTHLRYPLLYISENTFNVISLMEEWSPYDDAHHVYQEV